MNFQRGKKNQLIQCLAILFLLNIQMINSQFELIKLTQENGAKCMDGSPATIWVKKGDPKKFLVIIQGGSWVIDADVEKVKDFYIGSFNSKFGSSNNSYFDKPFEGEYLTSYDESLNPYFYDYTIVQINNCDKSGQQGYRKDPIIHKGKEIWIRGKLNFLEGIKYLYDELNMQNADSVTLGGFSAGGQSLYYWINHFGDELLLKNPNVQFQGFSDSGLFLDRKDMYTQEYNFRNGFKALFQITNQQDDTINEECVQEFPNEKYKCMLAQYNLKYIKHRVLIIQNQYDPSTGQRVIGTNCLRETGDWNKKEFQAYEEYRKQLLQLLENDIQDYKGNFSVYSSACRSHTTAYKPVFSSYDIVIPSGSDFNLQEALHQFIQEQKDFKNIDTDGQYPEANPQCKDLQVRIYFNNSVMDKIKKISNIIIILIITIIIVIGIICILRKRKLRQQISQNIFKNNKQTEKINNSNNNDSSNKSKKNYLQIEDSVESLVEEA